MHPKDENPPRPRRSEPSFFITEADGTWIVPPRSDGRPRMSREPSFYTNDDDDNWIIPPEQAPAQQKAATTEVDDLFDRDLGGELDTAIAEVEAAQQQRPASGPYGTWNDVRPPSGPNVTQEAFVGSHRNGAKTSSTQDVQPGFKAVGTFVAMDPQGGRQLFFKPAGAQNDGLMKFTGDDAKHIAASAPALVEQSLIGGSQGAPVQVSYDRGKGWSVEPAQQQQQQRRS